MPAITSGTMVDSRYGRTPVSPAVFGARGLFVFGGPPCR